MTTIPIVIASPMTANDNTQGVVSIRNIDITGFDVRFEQYDGQDHPLETIGWIAIKPGTHTLDGKTLVVGSTSTNETYSSVALSGLSTAPVVLTQIQSGGNSYGEHTRVNNSDENGFEVKLERNNNTTVNTMAVGYIAIESTTLKSGHAKVEETKYYPYGVIQEGGNERYLYTGKEMDKGTGLYYYEARYYNPNVGRFIQADLLISNPFNPQSLNRYSYVLNNPLVYIDPSGHAALAPYKLGYRNNKLYGLEMMAGLIADDKLGKMAPVYDIVVVGRDGYQKSRNHWNNGNKGASLFEGGTTVVRMAVAVAWDALDIGAILGLSPEVVIASAYWGQYFDELIVEGSGNIKANLFPDNENNDILSTKNTESTTSIPKLSRYQKNKKPIWVPGDDDSPGYWDTGDSCVISNNNYWYSWISSGSTVTRSSSTSDGRSSSSSSGGTWYTYIYEPTGELVYGKR